VNVTDRTDIPPAPAPSLAAGQPAAPPEDQADFAGAVREAMLATGTDAVGFLLAWPPEQEPSADNPLNELVAELAGKLAERLGPVRISNDLLLVLAVAGELVRWRGEFRERRDLAISRGDLDRATALESQYRALGVPLLDMTFATTVHRIGEEVRRLRPDAAPRPQTAA
jgi:hypothetical protein